MLVKTVATFFSGAAGFFAAVVLLYILYSLIKFRRQLQFDKNKFAALIFIIALPLMWYAALSNHSYVHEFLSYREFTIAFYGIAGFFVEKNFLANK